LERLLIVNSNSELLSHGIRVLEWQLTAHSSFKVVGVYANFKVVIALTSEYFKVLLRGLEPNSVSFHGAD